MTPKKAVDEIKDDELKYPKHSRLNTSLDPEYIDKFKLALSNNNMLPTPGTRLQITKYDKESRIRQLVKPPKICGKRTGHVSFFY